MKNLISKFSVIGMEECISVAKGNYTIVNIEFEYREKMHDGQITITKDFKTFSFMKRKNATRQSGLEVRDKVRFSVLSAYAKYREHSEKVISYCKQF